MRLRTREGWRIAMVWAIMPPTEKPQIWVLRILRESRRPTGSSVIPLRIFLQDLSECQFTIHRKGEGKGDVHALRICPHILV